MNRLILSSSLLLIIGCSNENEQLPETEATIKSEAVNLLSESDEAYKIELQINKADHENMSLYDFEDAMWEVGIRVTKKGKHKYAIRLVYSQQI